MGLGRWRPRIFFGRGESSATSGRRRHQIHGMRPSVRDGRAERTERWLIAAGPAINTAPTVSLSAAGGRFLAANWTPRCTEHGALSTKLSPGQSFQSQPRSSI